MSDDLPDGEPIDFATLDPAKAEQLFGAVMKGVRCPKCQWRPRERLTWGCNCGTIWNTFNTYGKCPGCNHEWTDTQCFACHTWSPHSEWYFPEGSPN